MKIWVHVIDLLKRSAFHLKRCIENCVLTAKFRVKKVGKTTRPFRPLDVNQIPYDCTVEVMNRFKGLDMVDRVPEELWTKVHNIVKEAVIKINPKKKECKRAKWLSEEALQIVEEKREVKNK